MKRIVGLGMAVALVFAGFGYGGVRSELKSNEDVIPKLTQADLNFVWLESKGSQTLGYNTLKVVNAYVGQTLTETMEIRNKTKETLTYALKSELMDCENKEVWQYGDRLAMKLSTEKVTLKAGEKKHVPVSVQVQKNHSGNAYFRIFVNPSKGKKEFVSLGICQFDTKAEIMTTKPPAMFKTLNDALKNKTKPGRLIRKPDKTFLIYGNIHLFCFDTKTGKFVWHYNNRVSIFDLWIHKGFIFTQNSEKLFIKDGKECVHKENEVPQYNYSKDMGVYQDYIVEEREFYNLGMTAFMALSMGESVYKYPLLCKSNLRSEQSWSGNDRSSHIHQTPLHPELIYVGWNGYRDSPDSINLYDLVTGNLVCDLGAFYRIVYKPDNSLLITYNEYRSLNVHDMVAGKNIFNLSIERGHDYYGYKFSLLATDTGTSIIFADYTEVGAYDYAKRKIAWRLYGDGEPLCDPVYDKTGNSVYVLDVDSKADSKGNVTKEPEYLRLFKFNASTGKQYWKAILFKIPEESQYFDGETALKGDKVEITYGVNTFTVRASDGKPAR